MIGIFKNLTVSGKRIIGLIRAFAPATLGAYLIHENELISGLLKGRFAWVGSIENWIFPLYVILLSAVLFAACLMIEKARQGLFRIIRVDWLIARISGAIAAQFRRIL